ncbi:MAG TPA: GNAT family N-acetyltransferase [Nocardioides sp.]|uniref:GNAT family N-acetyltransferase n=1 Tax=Nocardioides sp. TaxID=35761 RepID=UPI002E2EA84C|nr:GNAT family N-acetyltransferase [Nocardioides sp.]HEX3931193.1 GNAT family N-acetyltransferase [Nocardioides sp.]
MTELVIRPVDAQDPPDVDAFVSVYGAAERAADPEARLATSADATAMLGSQDMSFFLEGYGAFADDRLLAVSMTSGGRRDNLTLAQIQVWVHPDHRRRGVGTTLADAIETLLHRDGRTVLRTQLRAGPGHVGNQRFAESRGYAVVLSVVERRLRLPVDIALLDRLAAEAARRHQGYDVRVVVGPFPADLRASYVALRNMLIAEAPSGGLELEEAGETVENLVAEEARLEAAGRVSVAAFAVHVDQVVAYTEAQLPAGAHHVDQLGTLVHPAHRGRALGTAVKCAQLRAVGEGFPERAYIATANAEVNEHMVAINLALGFEVHQVWMELEKRLEPPGSQIG